MKSQTRFFAEKHSYNEQKHLYLWKICDKTIIAINLSKMEETPSIYFYEEFLDKKNFIEISEAEAALIL
jgi:hypothetical protein